MLLLAKRTNAKQNYHSPLFFFIHGLGNSPPLQQKYFLMVRSEYFFWRQSLVIFSGDILVLFCLWQNWRVPLIIGVFSFMFFHVYYQEFTIIINVLVLYIFLKDMTFKDIHVFIVIYISSNFDKTRHNIKKIQ